MIRGEVHPQGEPPLTGQGWITLAVSSPANPSLTSNIEATVGTGFSGHLTLGSETVAALALPRVREQRAVLATGEVRHFEVFAAIVNWDGQVRVAPVFQADGPPLLGMALLWGSRLTVDAQAGGSVVISAIPGE